MPPEDAEGKPLPLVVALHGMGGDENLFFEGYGAGLLVDLAKERRFVLVAPRAPDLAFDPGALERIVAVIRAEQEVDPARVYLLGHSMGAGMTTLFATRRPDLVRAACAIAGAGGAPKDLKVPLLVVVGGRDGIAWVAWGPPRRPQRGKEAGEVRGFPSRDTRSWCPPPSPRRRAAPRTKRVRPAARRRAGAGRGRPGRGSRSGSGDVGSRPGRLGLGRGERARRDHARDCIPDLLRCSSSWAAQGGLEVAKSGGGAEKAAPAGGGTPAPALGYGSGYGRLGRPPWRA